MCSKFYISGWNDGGHEVRLSSFVVGLCVRSSSSPDGPYIAGTECARGQHWECGMMEAMWFVHYHLSTFGDCLFSILLTSVLFLLTKEL